MIELSIQKLRFGQEFYIDDPLNDICKYFNNKNEWTKNEHESYNTRINEIDRVLILTYEN